LGEGVWASHASDLDVIAAVLSTEQLTTLTATLAAGESEAASEALNAALKAAMAQ